MMRPLKRWMVFRSRLPRECAWPLRVRSVGCYEVARGWSQEQPDKTFWQLFWTLEGLGRFRLGRRRIELPAGSIFHYRPGETHHMEGRSKVWKYYWITFDHPGMETWWRECGLWPRPISAGPCPAALFEMVAAALRRGTPGGDHDAAHQAHAIFLRAAGGTHDEPARERIEEARRWLEENATDPRFGVEQLAEKMGMHRTTLFRGFRTAHGLSPSRYLQNVRVQKAMAMLQDSRLQIQEVAWRSGFTDPNYFARTVRKVTGMSPGQFRRSMG